MTFSDSAESPLHILVSTFGKMAIISVAPTGTTGKYIELLKIENGEIIINRLKPGSESIVRLKAMGFEMEKSDDWVSPVVSKLAVKIVNTHHTVK